MNMKIRISSRDKQSMLSNLATMLNAGIPILEAVEALRTESKGGLRAFLKLVHDQLNEGHPLSQAFASAPEAFDNVTVNLIRSAEEGGTLDSGLKELAASVRRDAAFRDKIRSSLIYPAFIMTTFTGVLILILTFVVPRLQTAFTGLRVELPLGTKILFGMSDTLTGNFLAVIGTILVAALLTAIAYITHKREVLNLVLRLPVLHKLGILIDLTRFTHSLAQLLKAGIPIVDALALSQRVVITREMNRTAAECHELVAAGRPLSEGLRKHSKHVPAMMLQLIDAGEKSGSLDRTLQELSEHFELQVRKSLKMYATLIEPISLVVVGIIVGAMMLAIMAPMYGMLNQFRTK